MKLRLWTIAASFLLHGIALWALFLAGPRSSVAVTLATIEVSELPTTLKREPPVLRAQPAPRAVQENVQAVSTESASEEITRPLQASAIAGSGSDTALSRYLAELRAEIEKNKIYPSLARRMGMQGLIEVSFRLSQSGDISALALEKSSGFAPLNEAALNAVRRLGRFRPAPMEAGIDASEGLKLTLPIQFVLR